MHAARYFYARNHSRTKFHDIIAAALVALSFFATPCVTYSAPPPCEDLFLISDSLINSSLKESHLSFTIKKIDHELARLRKALEQPARTPSETSALINQTKRVRTALAEWGRLSVHGSQDAESFHQKLETLKQVVIVAENESHAAEF